MSRTQEPAPEIPVARGYLSQRVLRRTSSFELVSALRSGDGGPVTLLRPVGRRGETTEAALRRVVRAHEATAHSHIPRARLVQLGNRRNLAVELDAPATTDGATVIRRMVGAGSRLSYAQADAFVATVREVMRRAHASSLGDEGPLTFGRLCFGNVLVGEDGRWWLLGVGHNVVTDRLDGSIGTDEALFTAPEVALGAKATPSSDFVATLVLKRAVAHLVDVPDVIARAFAGDSDPAATRVAELAFWFERCVAGELPSRRPPLTEIEARVEEFAELLGQGLDPEGLQRALAQHTDPLRHLHPQRSWCIELGPQGAWARVGTGDRVMLGAAPGRVLAALATARDEPRSTLQLAAAGWPGEMMIPRAAANRVYVAMHRLRSLGLGACIERTSEGYRLTRVTTRFSAA